MRTREKFSIAVSVSAVFILCGLLLPGLACSPGRNSDSLIGPGDNAGQDTGGDLAASAAVVDLDLQLGFHSGPPPQPAAMLAVARDDTVSDSTHMYIDVRILNIGPDMVLISSQSKHLSLRVRLSFVDVPYYRGFDHGRLDIVVGQTDTGYQATEKLEFSFLADTTLTFELPVTRVDSFRVADNVAVYGAVLAKDRFVIADTVRVFRTSSAPAGPPKPDLTGFVRTLDSRANRLYVSNATVIITDTTAILDPEGNYLALGDLVPGDNRLTITALAWAYDAGSNMIANGWEFVPYDLFVARPITP